MNEIKKRKEQRLSKYIIDFKDVKIKKGSKNYKFGKIQREYIINATHKPLKFRDVKKIYDHIEKKHDTYGANLSIVAYIHGVGWRTLLGYGRDLNNFLDYIQDKVRNTAKFNKIERLVIMTAV